MNRLLVTVCAAVASLQLAWAGATKHFFVMIPPDFEEWMSSVPMLSLDGGKTGKPMTAVSDMCGWYSYAFEGESATDDVVLYRDDDDLREDMIGANGSWEMKPEKPQAIPLKNFFDMGTDSVFFVPDEEQKTNEDGFYYSKAEVRDFEGVCSYSLAALVYDTDASLHPAFSCYTVQGYEGCQKGALGISENEALNAFGSCIGVQQGFVESTLDPVVKKPKLTRTGQKCFINEQLFNLLFNYQEGVNEKRCYEIPFTRSADGKWEFDSDFYQSPGTKVPGGFYPVETSADASGDAQVLSEDPNQMPVRAARTKRDAEGPIFYGPAFRELDVVENVPKFDILCNGPGWEKGIDCSGLFFSGNDDEMEPAVLFIGGTDRTCVMGWSCQDDAPEGWLYYKPGTEIEVPKGSSLGTLQASPRWQGMRNQHFCYETHSKFTFKKGLKFSFRSSDDLWVFIDNKLAVDLGGMHLPAPAYVDLDEFLKGSAEPGDEMDLDIFACDRRTTMTGVRIKTNMLLRQKTTIAAKESKNAENRDESTFSLCYVRSGDGSCVSALSGSGSSENEELCGAQMQGLNIGYFVVNGFKSTDPIVKDQATGLDTINVAGVYFGGGLDLTTLYVPKVDTKKFALPSGEGEVYSLFVTIGGKTKRLKKWAVSSDETIVYRQKLDDKRMSGQNRSYVVMDLQGRIVRRGLLAPGAMLPALNSGSYVVKIGNDYRRVNIQ